VACRGQPDYSLLLMRPRSYQELGDLLVVVWEDGHESYFPLDELRKACPCANCSGEPDLFGRMSKGPPSTYRAESFQLVGIDEIGNYAILPRWADGHDWGIWTFERLRAACPCSECEAARQAG
jgi:DUF971 family protein